ncbi:conserved hypothetical protein [Methylocella silvestris BL2]|uniref:MSMEG_0570 family nitrogen starvation response protein n=1 Tax=Methylocella silvestris (strain DSM 15510 / CIP 108128 / LMG 27833 / NCIMB 13906 / BL2) TaxID=395965 RepID=B8EPT5_METSB|nr:MSMEG_0570 family nitrogen starvation response protein [Methylocella silvestris]ACK50939.1 conserved hypothetical protein [Methylocella silvestris BL2]
MPEMRFLIRWPDGSPESCYSPSLVVKDYLTPGASYTLDQFVALSRAALTTASARVEARYGRPCSLAQGQLASIEAKARRFAEISDPRVTVDAFEE